MPRAPVQPFEYLHGGSERIPLWPFTRHPLTTTRNLALVCAYRRWVCLENLGVSDFTFGIPAVFGIGSATHALHDGQSVVVDGNRGTVAFASHVSDQ